MIIKAKDWKEAQEGSLGYESPMVLETYSSLDPQLISNRENLPIFQERIKIFQELVGKSISSIGAKLEYRILDIGGG